MNYIVYVCICTASPTMKILPLPLYLIRLVDIRNLNIT